MRMQKVAEEKAMMEARIHKAAICIQRHARGMIARIGYKRVLEYQREREKEKLSNMLKNLQTTIKTCFNPKPPKELPESPLERAVLKI